jgi:hypothetical protein
MAGAQRIPLENGRNGNSISEKAKSFEIFYDSNRTSFWAPNSHDGWIMIAQNDVRRWLKERGCRSKRKKAETVSEIDALLNIFQRECDVEYAGSLGRLRPRRL